MQILNFFTIFFLIIFNSLSKDFPVVDIKTIDGKTVSTNTYIGKGNPVIVSLWATWCAPCKRELDNIADLYPDWKEKYGVEILAISIDNARQLRKIPGMVSSKGWEYTILTDPDGTLKNALGVATIPQAYLLDGEGKIVYDHNGYTPGDEEELEEILIALSEEKK